MGWKLRGDLIKFLLIISARFGFTTPWIWLTPIIISSPNEFEERRYGRIHVIPKSPIWAQVESASNPGSFYDIRVEDERVTCTCPHWTYRMSKVPNGRCKHIEAVSKYYTANRGMFNGTQ